MGREFVVVEHHQIIQARSAFGKHTQRQAIEDERDHNAGFFIGIGKAVTETRQVGYDIYQVR